MVEISLVDGLEGVLFSAVETGGELNGGVSAGAEVEGSAHAEFGRGGGVAGLFLGVAVSYGAGLGTAVHGVGAGVVLDLRLLDGPGRERGGKTYSAGSLKRSTCVDEGGAVDRERTVSGGGNDWWCGSTESSSESLDVGCSNVSKWLQRLQDINVNLLPVAAVAPVAAPLAAVALAAGAFPAFVALAAEAAALEAGQAEAEAAGAAALPAAAPDPAVMP